MKLSVRFLHVNKFGYFVACCVFFFFVQSHFLEKGVYLKPMFVDIPSLGVLFAAASLKILDHDERGLDKSIFRFVHKLVLMFFDCKKEAAHKEIVNFFRLTMWFFFSSMISWVAVLIFYGRW